jgi:PadR family transcriptional regulator, regulatory protein PadR
MEDLSVPSAWLRGLLDFCLLGLLDDHETYGYDLMRRLEGHGIGPVPGGSLYPALLRLERAGHLTSSWRAGEGGPGRKYYSLTSAGRAALARDVRSWRALSGAVDELLGGTSHGQGVDSTNVASTSVDSADEATAR